MQEMTLQNAVEALERLLDKFAFRSGGGDGAVITNSARALKFLRDFSQEWEIYYTGKEKEEVDRLTREALETDDQQELSSILLKFQSMIESGCYLPIQRSFVLWEEGKLNLVQLIIFLEDAYKLSSTMRGKNEAVRWAFSLLWRLARK